MPSPSPRRRGARLLGALLLVSAAAPGAASGLVRPRIHPSAVEGRTAPEAARWAVADALEQAGLPAGSVVVPAGERVLPSGASEHRFEQLVGGVPVFRGVHAVWCLPDATPLVVRVGDVAAGEPGPYVLGPEQAAAIAQAEIDGTTPPGAAYPGGRSEEALGLVRDGAGGWLEIHAPGAPLALARRVVDADGPYAAWRIEASETADPSVHWCVLVDATTGMILRRIHMTRHVAARGTVFPRNPDAGAASRDFVDADVNVDPASPAGWIAADQTIGNNAYVWEDRAGDGTLTAGAVATGTGDPLAFDFPFTGVPKDDLDAALTNVFWALNDAHDRLHRLGFDEPAGNMQLSNHGRGGLATDYPRTFVQYRAGPDANVVRNANGAYATTDGNYASLTFGLWAGAGGVLRDSAFDTGLIYHEYVHLMVFRLLGGDTTCDDGAQPAALSEGWSDYFAASFTGDPIIGAWVSARPEGLRTAPIGMNPYTYGNLCDVRSSGSCSRNEDGEIWSATLWDMRRRLVDLLGAEEGARVADQLVVEGMRMTPCRPTFLDARDGILHADLALFGGRHHCLIWPAFAYRGMGWSAASAGPDDSNPRSAYDPPPECSAGASLAWGRARYGDDADARIVLADAAAGGTDRVIRVLSSSGDAEDVVLPGPDPVRATDVALRPGAAVPGDGILQVADGDVVTARCEACPGVPQDTADVRRSIAFVVNSYSLTSETCHDDNSEPTVSDFINELPSVLDPGERAVLTVNVGNPEPFPLEDVRVRVTCDNPDVSVLPTQEIPLGRGPARWSGPAPIPVSLRVLAAPAPAVVAGDTATIRIDVTARGFEGTTSLTMPLAADYQAERAVPAFGGTETFEPSSPTAALWTHAPAAGQPADAWDLRACGDGGGRAMTYSGSSCTNYDDTPSAATVVSPPVYDLSNGVQVVHPVSLTWRNDVSLGVSPASLYCDSEMVVLYLTDTTSRISYASPLNGRFDSTQYWAQWTGLGDERNTNGWATGAPRSAITATTTSAMRLPDVRLYWVFYTDVYNPLNNGGCRLAENAVGPGYKLDNVSFTYDLVRLVPPSNASCAQPCAARAALTITPSAVGGRCAGDALVLDGSLSEVAGCAGATEYRLRGPGLDTGYQDNPVASAVAADGATWTVTVRCSTDTACSESLSIADPTLDDVDVGRVLPRSLRVRRDAADVVLSWDSTRSPVAHAVFRADVDPADAAGRLAVLAALAPNPPDPALRHDTAGEVVHRDSGAAADGVRLHVYRVLGSAPCSGQALDR